MPLKAQDIPWKRLTHLQKAAFAKSWGDCRNLARTDLRWLCHNILGFTDVVDHAHGPIIDDLQQFYGRSEIINTQRLKVMRSKPKVPLWDLPGQKQHLLLYPRGHLKTTLNCIAHSIQWMLNYPDIRILVTTATEDLATDIVIGIASQFELNEQMRFFFPEYCPKRGKKLGNTEGFTLPNRTDITKKESTLSIITATSSMAGPHYDVIKHSDVIDQFNSRTQGGLRTIASHFAMCIPLVETQSDSEGNPVEGWRTIEGTIYDYSDFHAELLAEIQIKREKYAKAKADDIRGKELSDLKEIAEEWKLTHRTCWANEAKTEAIWPEQFSLKRLIYLRDNPIGGLGHEMFANQYELNPMAEGTGLCNIQQLDKLWVPQRVINELFPTLRLHATVDLAGLERESTGDYSVITLAGFGRDGKMYILEIHRGHFDGNDVCQIMFEMDKRLNGRILDWKIEKEAHARGLKSTIEREQIIRNQHLLISYIPRDNQWSKQVRIKHSLRYWFSSGNIRFAQDIVCKDEVYNEVLRFPKYKHDDILDTLVDQTQNQGSGIELDMLPRLKQEIVGPWQTPHFNGFGFGGEAMFGDQTGDLNKHYDSKTGI